MIRYVERNLDGKIVSSYASPQPNKKLNQIDDQSEEYKKWERSKQEIKSSHDAN